MPSYAARWDIIGASISHVVGAGSFCLDMMFRNFRSSTFFHTFSFKMGLNDRWSRHERNGVHGGRPRKGNGMTVGENLLTLQEIDLDLARRQAELKELLELKELSRKRSAYKKLKAEETKLIAQRKDLEFELEDLVHAQLETEQKVTEAQHDAEILHDYRQLQDLQMELSDLAKQLDKNAFDQQAKQAEVKDARERESTLIEYVKKFEKALLDDAQKVRDQAAALKSQLSEVTARREKCARKLDDHMLERYEAARRAKGGLAVERLEGNVPSVCRMSLTEASIDELHRGPSITECPYCHRLLVVEDVVEDE